MSNQVFRILNTFGSSESTQAVAIQIAQLSSSEQQTLIDGLVAQDAGTIWVNSNGELVIWNGTQEKVLGAGGGSAVVNNYSTDEQPFYNPGGTQQAYIGGALVYWQTFTGVSVNTPPASVFGVITDLGKIVSFEATNEATGEPSLVQVKKSGNNLSACALAFNGDIVGDSVSYPSNHTITVWFTKTA
ncbi:MAG: hypothetical protein ACRCXN_13060 [Bacteroidales bacterium]